MIMKENIYSINLRSNSNTFILHDILPRYKRAHQIYFYLSVRIQIDGRNKKKTKISQSIYSESFMQDTSHNRRLTERAEKLRFGISMPCNNIVLQKQMQ
jgi:hypothetical protein